MRDLRMLTALRIPPSPLLARILGAVTVAILLGVWWLATRGEIPESRWVSPIILP